MQSMALPIRPSRRHATIQRLVAMGTALGLASASGQALAQTCTLSVRATPNVISAGQHAAVDVLAHFPSSMYALASAQFNVHATQPAWSFASSGLIAGPDVLGMNVWQNHAPHTGVFANPANPYRVWRGVFAPTSTAPALVEIQAAPSAIALYPQRLTSSSIPGEVRGDRTWLLVNPLAAGRWHAAPGPGTRARIGDDVIMDGTIITGENPAGTPTLGLLMPSVQKVPASSMTLRFADQPDAFALTVDVPELPGEQLMLNYTKVSPPPAGAAGMYEVSADMIGPPGTPIRFDAFRGGIRVATGLLDEQRGTLQMSRVPHQIGVSIQRERTGGTQLPTVLVTSYSIQANGSEIGFNGLVTAVDRVVLTSRQRVSGNNIRQLSLGCHVFEASGVRSMSIVPSPLAR